jgi:aconitase B
VKHKKHFYILCAQCLNEKTKKLKEYAEMVSHHIQVINDPMNGCPDDFAEDYAKIEWRKKMELAQLGATDDEIGHARFQGQHKAEEALKRIFSVEES